MKTIYISRNLNREVKSYGFCRININYYSSDNMYYWQRAGITFPVSVWEEYENKISSEYLYDEDGNILEDRELEVAKLIDYIWQEIAEYHAIEWDDTVFVD